MGRRKTLPMFSSDKDQHMITEQYVNRSEYNNCAANAKATVRTRQ